MFTYTILLKCLLQSKIQFFNTFISFVEVLRHFVMLLTVDSTFKYNQFWSVQVFDRNLAPTPPEIILYTRFLFKKKLQLRELIQTILHSYSGRATFASGKAVTAI